MNVIQIQDRLKDLSDRQLADQMQQGAVPQFLVLSELQRRKKMRQEATTPGAGPQGTVADELMQGAMQGGMDAGVASLPMEETPAFAGGGLVSFAQGGGITAKQEAEFRKKWSNENREKFYKEEAAKLRARGPVTDIDVYRAYMDMVNADKRDGVDKRDWAATLRKASGGLDAAWAGETDAGKARNYAAQQVAGDDLWDAFKLSRESMATMPLDADGTVSGLSLERLTPWLAGSPDAGIRPNDTEWSKYFTRGARQGILDRGPSLRVADGEITSTPTGETVNGSPHAIADGFVLDPRVLKDEVSPLTAGLSFASKYASPGDGLVTSGEPLRNLPLSTQRDAKALIAGLDARPVVSSAADPIPTGPAVSPAATTSSAVATAPRMNVDAVAPGLPALAAAQQKSEPQIHQVLPKETIYGISKQFGVEPARLMEANGIKDPTKLAVGMPLVIPETSKTAATASATQAPSGIQTLAAAPAPQAKALATDVRKSEPQIHEVLPKETVYGISKKFGVEPARLMEANGITDPTQLAVGTPLVIPEMSKTAATAKAADKPAGGLAALAEAERPATVHGGTVIVEPGDTLTKISKGLGVSVAALEKANPGINPNKLPIGHQLTVPAGARAVASDAVSPSVASTSTSGDRASAAPLTGSGKGGIAGLGVTPGSQLTAMGITPIKTATGDAPGGDPLTQSLANILSSVSPIGSAHAAGVPSGRSLLEVAAPAQPPAWKNIVNEYNHLVERGLMNEAKKLRVNSAQILPEWSKMSGPEALKYAKEYDSRVTSAPAAKTAAPAAATTAAMPPGYATYFPPGKDGATTGQRNVLPSQGVLNIPAPNAPTQADVDAAIEEFKAAREKMRTIPEGQNAEYDAAAEAKTKALMRLQGIRAEYEKRRVAGFSDNISDAAKRAVYSLLELGPTARAPAAAAPPAAPPAAPAAAPAPAPAPASTDATKGTTKGTTTGTTTGTAPVVDPVDAGLEALMKKMGESRPKDYNRKGDESNLADIRKEIAESRKSNANMALMHAGLAMMAGSSPYALQNIGAGAMAGLEKYASGKKDIVDLEKDITNAKIAMDKAARAEEWDEYKANQEEYKMAVAIKQHADELKNRILATRITAAGNANAAAREDMATKKAYLSKVIDTLSEAVKNPTLAGEKEKNQKALDDAMAQFAKIAGMPSTGAGTSGTEGWGIPRTVK